MWAYVLILIIGVAVTVAGVRLGRRRREDPFADVAIPDDATTSEPAAFTSHREPTPLGAADDEIGGSPATVAGPRVPRATLEERLRAARDARASEHEDAEAGDAANATTEAATAVEPSAAVADGGDPTTVSTTAEISAGAVGSPSPASTDSAEAERPPAEEATSAVEPAPIERDTAPEAPPPARQPLVEPVAQRALAPEVREDFAQRWTPIRMRLLARPSAAVGDADAFVRELLEARGLPNDPDDPAMAEASNAYPDVIDPFRLATAIARSAEDGTADPQQVRLATVHYRDAVERLLAVDDLPVA